VKRLIELHGGQLVIDSIEGVGTKASILFPPYRVVTTNERAKLAV
jgi:signal transduction histidine kinase